MQNKKEYIWAMFGKFIPQILFVLTTIILARLLSPDDFGTIGVLSIFITSASVLMDSGLGGSLIKEESITIEDCSTIFSFNIIMSFLTYLVMFFIAPYLETYFEIDGLKNVTRILSLIFIINAFGLVPSAMLTKDLKFKEITLSCLISTIIAMIVAVIWAIIFHDVYSLVFYQLSQALVMVLFYKRYYRIHIPFSFKKQNFKKLLPFGFLTTASSIIDSLYENITITIFGKMLGLAEAGYLTQAKKIEEVPSKSIITTLSNVSFPILVKLKDDFKSFNDEALNIFRIVTFLLLPLFGLIILLSRELITLLFGTQWIAASDYLKLLAFAGIFVYVEVLFRGFLKSINRPKALFQSSIVKRTIGLSILIIISFISVQYLLYGYIISSVISSFITIGYYINIINVPILKFLNRLVYILLYPLLFVIIAILVNTLVDNDMYKIIISIALSVMYYFCFLPYKGIRIFSIIKNIK